MGLYLLHLKTVLLQVLLNLLLLSFCEGLVAALPWLIDEFLNALFHYLLRAFGTEHSTCAADMRNTENVLQKENSLYLYTRVCICNMHCLSNI